MNLVILPSLAQLPAAEWDALAPAGQPFLRHAFLVALEDSGSVGAHCGWQPAHRLLRDDGGQLCAAAPAYVKSHSRGEYVFDWAGRTPARGPASPTTPSCCWLCRSRRWPVPAC